MDDPELREKLQLIWPEVIGVVITKRGQQVDVCPVNFQAVSTIYETPLVVCIGLSNQSYTLETIRQTKEFVYAYPAKEHVKDVLLCGESSGRGVDKTKQTSLQFVTSKAVAPPNLQGAVLNYECKVVHQYDAGDFTVVVGEVLRINTSGKEKLDYTLGGEHYGSIQSLETLQEGR